MASSFTQSDTRAFTLTHAKKLASKVATDLLRLRRLYGDPSEHMIDQYEAEAVAFLRAGHLKRVTYGYRRGGKWIEPTLDYTAEDLNGQTASNDMPGKIRPGRDISGASFYSYLNYNSSWFNLTEQEKSKFTEGLLSRSSAERPRVDGYLESDKTYSSGGRAINRKSVRSHK